MDQTPDWTGHLTRPNTGPDPGLDQTLVWTMHQRSQIPRGLRLPESLDLGLLDLKVGDLDLADLKIKGFGLTCR